jgi:hypothetical protein
MTTTYKTANLKADIDNHEVRIVKLEKSSGCFDDHMQRHADVFDPTLKKHDRTLYGEHGDDGMTFNMKEVGIAINSINKKLDEKSDNNKWLYRLVVGTFLTSVITAFLTLVLK